MDEAKAMELVDEMASDPTLRAAFQQDPVGTFERAGIQLDDDDRQALSTYAGMGDEALLERISKGLY
jgi:hypothetical protein